MPLPDVGGFFPLFSGLSLVRRPIAASKGIILDSGRSCLSIVLDSVKPERLHLPFYLCDEIHTLVKKRDREVIYYAIERSLEPTQSPQIQTGDLFTIWRTISVLEVHS